MRDEAKKANNNRKTARANLKHSATDTIDAEYVATIVRNSLSRDLGKMCEEIKDLRMSLCNSQNLFQKNMQDILMKFQKEIANSISNPCIRPHVEQPAHTEPVNTGTGSIPSGNTPPFVPDDIIQEAMRFANKESIDPSNVSI